MYLENHLETQIIYIFFKKHCTSAHPSLDHLCLPYFLSFFSRIFIREGSCSQTNNTSPLCVYLLDEDANSRREIIVL